MKYCAFFIFCLLGLYGQLSAIVREREQDRTPLKLTQENPSTQLFSSDDLRQLASHDATLNAIDSHLGAIDGKLTTIQSSLDHEVMPTIHVMNFLEWIFAIAVAGALTAIIGVAVNNRLKKAASAA